MQDQPNPITDHEAAEAAAYRKWVGKVPEQALRHSARFRKVSTRYAHVVAEAYGHDLARAEADSDEQVAATVAEWERGQGIEPRDWYAIGAEERGEREGQS